MRTLAIRLWSDSGLVLGLAAAAMLWAGAPKEAVAAVTLLAGGAPGAARRAAR